MITRKKFLGSNGPSIACCLKFCYSGDPNASKLGEVAEWSNARDLKSCNPKGFVGSNPTLSAQVLASCNLTNFRIKSRLISSIRIFCKNCPQFEIVTSKVNSFIRTKVLGNNAQS